ncbi:hypothetical protein NUSPORA_00339 [Nucleospora cyclopteri]
MARTKTQMTTPSKGGKIYTQKTPVKKPLELISSLQAASKPKKFKPGTLALKEIRKYQKSTDLLLRKMTFKRVVREIIRNLDNSVELRFQAASFSVLQESTENFLVGMLEDSYRCAIHAKRVTLMPRDINLIYKIKYSTMIHAEMVSK